MRETCRVELETDEYHRKMDEAEKSYVDAGDLAFLERGIELYDGECRDDSGEITVDIDNFFERFISDDPSLKTEVAQWLKNKSRELIEQKQYFDLSDDTPSYIGAREALKPTDTEIIQQSVDAAFDAIFPAFPSIRGGE